MFKPKCDLCDNDTRDFYLHTLNEEYIVDGCKYVCDECQNILQKQLDKLEKITHKIKISFWKRFVINFRKNL